MKMHNEDPIESFVKKRVRSRSTESWQVTVHAVRGWAVISWICSRVGLRIVYTIRSLHRRWKLSYRISSISSSKEPCLKIPGPFKSTLSTNPAQHDGSHLRAASWRSATWMLLWWLLSCCGVCSLAHAVAIGSELSDIIDAFMLLSIMSLPMCGFWWPPVEGFYGILRVNEIDHDVPKQQSGQTLHSNTNCPTRWLLASAFQCGSALCFS